VWTVWIFLEHQRGHPSGGRATLYIGLARTVYIHRTYTPYMTVYLVNSLLKIPYIHRIYMVLANPIYTLRATEHGTRCHCWGPPFYFYFYAVQCFCSFASNKKGMGHALTYFYAVQCVLSFASNTRAWVMHTIYFYAVQCVFSFASNTKAWVMHTFYFYAVQCVLSFASNTRARVMH